MPAGSSARGAGIGLLAGAWLGVVDGARALLRVDLTAGPLLDRLGTMGVAIGLDALALAVVGAGAGLFLRRLPWAPPASRLVLPGLAALLAGAAVAAVLGPRPSPPVEGRSNVLLVSVDTLRPDHLSAYGYPRETSPNLDALAREGVLFETAYSHSSWTLPAHVSLLTGLDPFAHGVLTEEDALSDAYRTLAETLAEHGYWTGAWVGTWNFGFVGAKYGFDQGFALYRHYPHPRRFMQASLARRLDRVAFARSGEVGNARAEIDSVLRWLRAGRSEPFFAFVHLYDTHSKFHALPYEAPEPFRTRFCEGGLGGFTGCGEGGCASDRLLAMARGAAPPAPQAERALDRCLYDGAIAFVDQELGRLFDALDAEGLAERTAVIVTSDHGEAFFEHGQPLHRTLHDEITRVPLVVRIPGAASGKRARGLVRTIDVPATILDLAGVPAGPQQQGRSLVPVLRSWPERADGTLIAVDRELRSLALRQGDYKWIEAPGPRAAGELYDLARDAGELFDLSAQESARVRQLREELRRRRGESEALRARLGLVQGHAETPDARERARLRALGYLDDDPPPATREE